MEVEQDKTGRSKMLRLLLLFLISGIIIQKTWKSSKNAEGILELVIDRTTQSGTAEISPLLSKWIAEAFFIYKI